MLSIFLNCGLIADMGKLLMTIKRGDYDARGLMFWGWIEDSQEWISPAEYGGRLADLAERKKVRARGYSRTYWQKADRAFRNRRLVDAKAWRKANPDKNNECVTAWTKANQERAKQIRRKSNAVYYAKNRSKFTEKYNARKAAKLKATSPDHNPAVARVLADSRDRVERCTRMAWHLDHVMPLASGGVHAHHNLQVLPAVLNLRKKDNPTFKLPSCYRMPA